jgi:hypothetical protein
MSKKKFPLVQVLLFLTKNAKKFYNLQIRPHPGQNLHFGVFLFPLLEERGAESTIVGVVIG